MKKGKLATLAVIGINAGLLLCSFDSKGVESLDAETKGFYEMLDADAKKQFLELDQDHRNAALNESYEHGCGATAACKGIREDAVRKQYEDQKKKQQ